MRRSFVHLAATNLGGAGIAAERLHEALRDAGDESHLVIHRGAARDPSIIETHSPLSDLLITASKAYFRATSVPKYHFRNQQLSNPGIGRISRLVKELRPDAIISYFITSYLSFQDVHAIQQAAGAPVIWFLMDMATLTGGCHYSWECRGYEQGCGSCPALIGRRGPNDHSARTCRSKAHYLDRIESVVVSGSSWLAGQARASALFRDRRIEVIPLGVSPELFRPRDRAELRLRLGLDPARPLIFLGARDASDPRKGMALLVEALGRIAATSARDSLPGLLIAGDAPAVERLKRLGYPVRTLGLVGPGDLAEAYAAADLFVSPSIEDSGPMMVNEAVMSGTPVVSFPIGVALDLVKPGETGEFARSGDSESLAAALTRVLAWPPEKRDAATGSARAFAVRTFSPAAQAERIVGLADDLGGRLARNSGLGGDHGFS
ncbi:MAG TPA: glycosyltransferase [Allosphingosinicella sp.]|nr:glycosyltransferase [Allosphingosinicella sp.]